MLSAKMKHKRSRSAEVPEFSKVPRQLQQLTVANVSRADLAGSNASVHRIRANDESQQLSDFRTLSNFTWIVFM